MAGAQGEDEGEESEEGDGGEEEGRRGPRFRAKWGRGRPRSPRALGGLATRASGFSFASWRMKFFTEILVTRPPKSSDSLPPGFTFGGIDPSFTGAP